MAVFNCPVYRTNELWQTQYDLTIPGGGLVLIEFAPQWGNQIQPQEGIVLVGVTYRILTHAAVTDIETMLRTRTGATNAGNVVHYLGAVPHSAAATQIHAYYPIDLLVKPIDLKNEGLILVTGTFPANDLISISAWGYITSATQLQNAVQPVSLEGYKWPLTRR